MVRIDPNGPEIRRLQEWVEQHFADHDYAAIAGDSAEVAEGSGAEAAEASSAEDAAHSPRRNVRAHEPSPRAPKRYRQ